MDVLRFAFGFYVAVTALWLAGLASGALETEEGRDMPWLVGVIILWPAVLIGIVVCQTGALFMDALAHAIRRGR